jgi:Cyclophilin type peptidyl-prolyl cis-trans isomerase/CLD
VFGKVVGGIEILDKLEAIPTDHEEKPQQDIKINNIVIFVDPFDVMHHTQFTYLTSRNGKRSVGTRNLRSNKKRRRRRNSRKTM